MQKLQAKRLDKKQEKENYFKKDTQVLPYRPGSAKRYMIKINSFADESIDRLTHRFAANTLVSLLFEVRHKKAAKVYIALMSFIWANISQLQTI